MGRPAYVAKYPVHGVVVRPPTAKDLDYLERNLRYADRLECDALGLSPSEALWKSLRVSERVLVVERKGKPAVIFGVCKTTEDVAAVWMLATNDLKRFPRLFARECRYWLAEIGKGYSLLWNYVDCRNKLHHRWLKWCGFKFIRQVNRGPLGLLFYEVAKKL